jgi:hypothetical protein
MEQSDQKVWLTSGYGTGVFPGAFFEAYAQRCPPEALPPGGAPYEVPSSVPCKQPPVEGCTKKAGSAASGNRPTMTLWPHGAPVFMADAKAIKPVADVEISELVR